MGEQRVRQIVERCQRGDREAFGQLYEAMYERLRQVCRRYVADENAVDDLLHDSFLLIFSKIGSLKDASKAEAWMQKVTQNLALAYVQHHKQESLISLDELKQPLTAAAPTAMPITYDEIMNLVDALPKSYRRVFRLSVLEGLSHQEIAALLNIEPHTSSAQLFRAKKILRQSLNVLLFSLLAVCLPLGVWYALRQPAETLSSPEGNGPTAVAKPVSEQNGRSSESRPLGFAACYQRDARNRLDGRVATDEDKVNDSEKQVVQAITTDSTISYPIETSEADTTKTQEKPQRQILEERNTIAETPESPVIKTDSHSDWMVALAYSGINGRQSYNLPYGEKDMNDPVLDTITHHRLPLTIALQVNKMLSKQLSIGTGLQYTQLYSETHLGNTYTWEEQQQRLHYLGIPLRLSWYPVRSRRWAVYGTVQTMLELPLHATQKTTSFVEGNQVEAGELKLSPSLQWSVGIGAGLEYRLTPVIGIYAEPSLQYFFKSGDGLDSWRTAHPAALSVPIGIRITF